MSANGNGDDGPPSLDTQLDRLEAPEPVRKAVMRYYQNYRDFYAEPWRELDQTRRIFQGGDDELRVSLLVLSYIYAVMSTRTAIDDAERHFTRVYEGDDLRHVMVNDNNINSKANYIYDALDYFGYVGFAGMANQLADGKVEATVDEMDETYEFKNIATVKAPFVVSQLGFTSKMCIDSNVQNFLGLDLGSINIDGDDMRKICGEVKHLFPEVYAEVEEAYHLQWILFNFERVNNVHWEPGDEALELDIGGMTPVERIDGLEPEKHDAWFDATLDDPERIKDRIHELFQAAPKAEMGLPSRM